MAGDFRVVEYEARRSEAFRDVNLSWIEEYFEAEEIDRRQLLDPEGTILRPGGAIPYCAKSQPTRNASNSGILEAGMVVALGPPLTP